MRKWLLGVVVLALLIGVVSFGGQQARGGIILHDWESTSELQDWLDQHIWIEFTAGQDYTLSDVSTLNNATLLGLPIATSGCTDYAMRLSDLAVEDGYRLSLAITDMQGNIGPIHVSPEYHMGNLAVVGDSLYFVEPQTDSIVYVSPLRK